MLKEIIRYIRLLTLCIFGGTYMKYAYKIKRLKLLEKERKGND